MTRHAPRWLRGRRARRGMTLMEVMVSVTIVLIMSLIIAESLSNSIEYQRILEDRDVTIRQARVTLSKIRREVEQAYLTPSTTALETVQTVFVGQDEEPDSLFFATMSHQRVYRDSRECDQSEITLWTERATEAQGAGFVLYHRESPRVDHEPDLQGGVYPLAYNVRSFNLRYLDPKDNEWKPEWDTRSSETLYRLPRAVEVGLVLIAPDPTDAGRTVDVPFVTSIALNYGGRLTSIGNPLANSGGQSLFGGLGNPTIPPPFTYGQPWQGVASAQLPGAAQSGGSRADRGAAGGKGEGRRGGGAGGRAPSASSGGSVGGKGGGFGGGGGRGGGGRGGGGPR